MLNYFIWFYWYFITKCLCIRRMAACQSQWICPMYEAIIMGYLLYQQMPRFRKHWLLFGMADIRDIPSVIDLCIQPIIFYGWI